MLNSEYSQQGVSLIELIVGMVIVGILAAIGAPALSIWMQNGQIRTTADAFQNGLQLARAEAVHRNDLVRFQLTTTTDNTCTLSTTGSSWVVSRGDSTGVGDPTGSCGSAPSDTTAPFIIQSRSGTEGSGTVTVTAGQSTFVFSGLGRTTNIAGTVTISVSNPAGGACMPAGPVRCLNVIVATGGQSRLCNPALPSSNPQGC